MDWVSAVAHLRRERRAGVLVTVAAARGHAPREAGAKMVVADGQAWGTVGGGNLEATATARARVLLTSGATTPELLTISLSDRAPAQHGLQCCGGEATLLLEPLPAVPAVAVFGVGHVGLELARILARHDVDLHLVDSRPAQLAPARLAVLDDALAHVSVHAVGHGGPALPEMVLADLPAGTHVLVMTHDHGEDAALCDAALRRDDLGSIGLVGSAAKWSRFRARLAAVGHGPADLERITTPIGLPAGTGPASKDPAVIAVSVAAALLTALEHPDRGAPQPPGATRSGAPRPDPTHPGPADLDATEALP